MATLKELADLVEGTVVGEPDLEIRRLAPFDEAGPGDITFIANPKYLARITSCQAAAVIVAPGVSIPGTSLIVTKNPYLAFAKILTHFQGGPPAPLGVMQGAVVDASATLEEDVTVYPGCYVGRDVFIGRGTVLYPNVVLYDGAHVGAHCLLHAGVVVRESCRIGDRCILQPAAVIGADGFGFAPDGQRYYKIPQVGTVILEEDVEIGAGSCIDRAALGVTHIRRGVKIDNLVQIGHNVEVGEDTILVSQVGIAGSTVIGRHCTFGGQVGVAGHLKIGDNVMIGAKGGVAGNLESNQVLSGAPVMPHKEWLKASMSLVRLPEMRKEVSRLKKQVEELEMLIKER